MTSGPAGGPGQTVSGTHHRQGFGWELFLLFAGVGSLAVLAVLIPFPADHLDEILVAAGLFLLYGVLVVTLPWTRIPRWWWSVVPVGFIAVLALLRDARGGTGTGITTVFIVPVVWLALYGRRSHLLVGLVALLAALVIPVLVVGAPRYPPSEWRTILFTEAVGSLLGFSVLALVDRERRAAARAAEQSEVAIRAARAAEHAHQQVASLLRAANQTAIIGTDPEGVITFFSPGAEQLLGYDADAVVGTKRFVDLIDRDELTDVATHNGTAHTLTFLRCDGSSRRMSTVVTGEPTIGRPEELSGYVVVAADVTDREEFLRQRERLLEVQREVTQILVEQNHQLRELTQMKDNVVATVSHELRTPLTVIRGFIDLLLQEEGTLSPEQARMLCTIDRNAQQLLDVSEDLLADPGRLQHVRTELTDVDLANLIAQGVEALQAEAARRGVSLSTGSLEEVTVRGDPRRLNQLLANLVSNALKFTPRSGHVQVEVANLDRLARIDVADDGPGIPVDERSRLFDRFFRLASSSSEGIPGSGLGLAIARTVVEAHHGTIAVVDTPGWSTTFRVHLPAKTGPEVGGGAAVLDRSRTGSERYADRSGTGSGR